MENDNEDLVYIELRNPDIVPKERTAFGLHSANHDPEAVEEVREYLEEEYQGSYRIREDVGGEMVTALHIGDSGSPGTKTMYGGQVTLENLKKELEN